MCDREYYLLVSENSHLAIHCSNDSGAYLHTHGGCDMKRLMLKYRLQYSSEEDEYSVEVASPEEDTLVFSVCNQLPGRTIIKSILEI